MKHAYSIFLLPLSFVFADPSQESADSYNRGYTPPPLSSSPAYNAPSGIKLERNWQFFTSGSFLYWLADQEGLDLAMSASLIAGEVSVPPVSVALFQKTEYQPGFKVGLGLATDHDDWMTGLEYTWIRQTTHTSSNAPSVPIGVGVWFISNWFVQPNALGETISATSIKSKWHLGIDLLDAYLGRPFYQGRYLTFAPFAGLRAAWIRQDLEIKAADPQAPTPWVNSHNNSRSWALGPKLGLEGSWLLGKGIRIESDLAGSILYTRYTSVNHSEDATSSNTIPVAVHFSNYGCVRSITEMSLGLGWGTYLSNNKASIDLLAAYDFSVFWNQNMIRNLVDLNTLQQNDAVNNLYLHGLTVTLLLNY